MGRLFGTDGIRGVANTYPMTSEVALNVGRAIAFLYRENKNGSTIVIGRDTRISGPMIEYAIVSGICSMGVNSCLAGVLPTPAVAFLTSSIGASAGVMVSASHNPFYDNGIKIFNGKGYKLSDEQESKIELLVLNGELASTVESIRETGDVYDMENAGALYTAYLKDILKENDPFHGIKIIIDCSNGATYGIAPIIFSDLGADVEAIFASPDGKNINKNCGSQHIDSLAQKVIEKKADIGLAFDGDGDRLIAIDDRGQRITGDRMLAINAKYMKKNGVLKNNLVVSTVMSNLGLCLALKQMGVNHMMAPVGDRYVAEQMITSGSVLGGEDSGHVIFLNHHTTGDGILTALKLLEIMTESSMSLSQLSDIMTVFPQKLINVEVKHKPEIQNVPEIIDAIRSVETKLGEEGRVLVRYSGTQPLCRIMVEGSSREDTERYCRQIADVVEDNLGE